MSHVDEWLTHFSDIIGASHAADFKMWEYDGFASEGVRSVAEHGATKKLEAELKAQVTRIYILPYILTRDCDLVVLHLWARQGTSSGDRGVCIVFVYLLEASLDAFNDVFDNEMIHCEQMKLIFVALDIYEYGGCVIQSGKIRTIIKARGLWYPNVNGKTFAVFRVDRKHHVMSALSMLGPSPDWLVGVSSLELCLKNCSWLASKTINLYPWDAGTSDGLSYVVVSRQLYS